MARTVMNSKNKNASTRALEEQLKQLQNEEISDRTPILSEIVNKWKNVNKFKKQMIDKYIKNANNIRKAFDEIMIFLCIDDYNDLPIIYDKSEQQLADIKMYISKLENAYNDKLEKKKILEEQICRLKEQKAENSERKNNFNEIKILTIDKLKAEIKEKEYEIKNMIKYFKALKPNTNEFLNKLNKTYLAEYVPNKIPLEGLTYNAENIQLIFDNVQNYVQIITEFDAGVAKQNEHNANLELDALREEIKLKLETISKENFKRMKNPKNKEPYESSFKSGLRNIDFENQECVVLGKGDKERIVYFDARAKLHLQNYLNSRKDNNPALFVSLLKPHARLEIPGVEIRLRKLGRKLDIPKVHPHKFRRTLATKAIDKGMPVDQVKTLLGHSQLDTTMEYAIVNQTNVKNSHKKYIA